MAAPAATGIFDRARLARMAGLAAVGLLAVAIEAAPLGLSATAAPSPDLVYCAVALWALRAPGETPPALVFALGLVRDLATDLPVGLGALALVLAAEALKANRAALARQPFLLTVGAVGLGAAAMALGLWLGVAVSLAEPPGLARLAEQVAATTLAYPLMAGLFVWVLGLGGRRRGRV